MSATQSYLQRQAKVFFCEFFGTALVLAIGCMGCTESFGPVFQGPTNEALTFSIATMTATRIFVHFSGGHVNPSITLVSVLVQMTPIWLAPSYFAGQFTGALAGFALLNATVSGNNEGAYNTSNFTGQPKKSCGTCSPSIPQEMLYYEALFFEFFVTTILCWVWCIMWDYRNIQKMEQAMLRYGLSYYALIICGISVTKSHMNPARSFAPALINWHWKDQWIFWIGPYSGACFAALSYRYLLYEQIPEEVF